MIDVALGQKPASVLTTHYRGKLDAERVLRLFEADVAAHGGLDATKPVGQCAPVQSASELRSDREGATENADRPMDGLIAQSVELRTFNP